jgi:hypothetical protein
VLLCYRCVACAGVLQLETSKMRRSSVSKSVECRRLYIILLISLSGGDGIRLLGRDPPIRVFLNALVRVDPSGDGR